MHSSDRSAPRSEATADGRWVFGACKWCGGWGELAVIGWDGRFHHPDHWPMCRDCDEWDREEEAILAAQAEAAIAAGATLDDLWDLGFA